MSFRMSHAESLAIGDSHFPNGSERSSCADREDHPSEVVLR